RVAGPGLRDLRRCERQPRAGWWLHPAMMKLDHLNLTVSNLERSRAWWVETLGLKVEFEVEERRSVALNDGEGFAIFLTEQKEHAGSRGIALWFQVDDTDAAYAAWKERGVVFAHE